MNLSQDTATLVGVIVAASVGLATLVYLRTSDIGAIQEDIGEVKQRLAKLEASVPDNLRERLSALETTVRSSESRNYVNQGVLKFDRGEYAAAMSDFELALNLQPDVAEDYLKVAWGNGDLRADLEGAVEEYPEFTALLDRLRDPHPG